MSAPDPSRDLAALALAAAKRHADWLAAYGPTSWDPYDFWSRPLARRAKAFYYRHARLGLPGVSPFVLLDTFVPESRALVWHRQRFATSDAHYAMGMCLLARGVSREWLARAVPFLEALVSERCPHERDYCWGYPFDWETCVGLWPAGTPLITVTPYGYEAFAAGHELTGSQECLAIMESCGRFAFERIRGVETTPGAKASTYTPGDRRRVVNASAYRAYLLAAAGRRFAHPDWIDEAAATVAFVVGSQRADGSWLYAEEDGNDAFIDNFHTCFVLKSLVKLRALLDDDSLTPVISRGYEFYKARLLDEAGLPIPFARTQRFTFQRRDLYDYAEGINLGLLLAGEDADAAALAARLVRDLLDGWVLPDGHFVTRKTIVGANTVPYHRWAQAQAFRSLVLFALEAPVRTPPPGAWRRGRRS